MTYILSHTIVKIFSKMKAIPLIFVTIFPTILSQVHIGTLSIFKTFTVQNSTFTVSLSLSFALPFHPTHFRHIFG